MARLNRNESGEQGIAGAVSVTSTAAEVRPLRSKRVSLSVRNNGTTDVFLGLSAAVTTATGYTLKPDEEFVWEDYVGPVYVITATTGNLRYLEIF